MIDDDQLTPDEAAGMFLDVAHEGLNSGTECTATPTLTLYDLESEDNLNEAINALGESLTQSLTDPQNRAAIEDDIERTDVVNGFRRGADAQHRDLGRFLDELEQSIAGGEINDRSGELRAAVDRARDALDQVVVSYFAGEDRYEDMGGMSIYLPESPSLEEDASRQSAPRGPLDFPPDLIEQLGSLEGEDELEKAIGDIARRLTSYTNFLGTNLPEGVRDDLEPLIESVRTLQSADATNYEERLESVIRAAEAFQQSEAGRVLVEEQNRRASERLAEIQERLAEIYALEHPEEYQGWSQFTAALAPFS